MKAKILVADGCELVAHTVGQLATRFGYEVTACVSTGAEALESVQRDPPDLALIDLHMGGEVSGTEVAMELAASGHAVVFLSALPTERSFELARLHGARGVLSKPFGTAEFRREVQGALAALEARSEASAS